MSEPILADFADLVLEVEFTPGSGSYAKICAMEGITINRSKQIDSNEVPADCDDDTLPYKTRNNTRSRSYSISGTGFWAQSSHGKMLDWFNGNPAEKLNIRITHAKAAVGDPELESGLAILSELNNERSKGPQISANISLVIDGDLTTTDKAA